ncbi:hypothetical protein HII36_36335 [Nonomuraea sp. NN258]|uniref:hypothetical protein n=1 Tax=Nonomuraea antri TaxID=2730852 RepID=UPI0015687768|nr:hypothetical protein [Nonomuraea antri]NRQ37268.1 hypothetical protein [Nonomuraea antri]
MPGVSTVDELTRAVAEFATDEYELPIEEPALERAARSLEETGLLLLGELHGVRENPLVVMRLMDALGLRSLALEWSRNLEPHLAAYLDGGGGLDHPLWWTGDGRITAGHLAVLKAMSPVKVTLFDGAVFTGDWSQRDAAMAQRVLAAHEEPTLVVAGNAHTPTSASDLGLPMGACLASARPAVRSITIDYGTGSFYNTASRRVRGYSAAAGLRVADGDLVVGLPEFGEAVVPHMPVELLEQRLGLGS